jgi:hypothetical protein
MKERKMLKPKPLLGTHSRLPSVTDRDVLEYLLHALVPNFSMGSGNFCDAGGRRFRFTPQGNLAEITPAPSREKVPL